MLRRLPLLLLAALALLLAGASASLAASPAAPAAHAAADEDLVCPDDQMAVEEEDGTVVCSSDELGDEGTAGTDESFGDDDGDLCDDWSDGEDDGFGDDGEMVEDDGGDDASIAAADDDACADAEDDAPPLLSALRAKVAGQGRRARVEVGFTLDAAGSVKLTLERTAAGVAAGKRCVLSVATPAGRKAAKARHAHKGGKGCTRTSAVRGTLVTAGDEGANAVTVRRWKGRPLAPGSYRLTAAPTGAGATASTTTFTLPAR